MVCFGVPIKLGKGLLSLLLLFPLCAWPALSHFPPCRSIEGILVRMSHVQTHIAAQNCRTLRNYIVVRCHLQHVLVFRDEPYGF